MDNLWVQPIETQRRQTTTRPQDAWHRQGTSPGSTEDVPSPARPSEEQAEGPTDGRAEMGKYRVL